MKSSLGKLRRFVHKNYAKEKGDLQSSAKLDELAQAAQVMLDMRNCYDSLLSAAAATANSAYEFSESLHEMGSCLLEKTSLHEDEDSGKILSMLGKVQFELQKLVDTYRAHIFLTITNPSESLLNELRTVEEMKRQCDEKRDVYEYMMKQQKEKGRSKSGKSESFTTEQLRAAHDEYDEEANLCVFRLKSLKQGQSHSLLTQAARHHAAQLYFFRKGLKLLEAVEPQVKLVAQQQHIDFEFAGLEYDDGEDGEDDSDNLYKENDIGELSFEYRAKDVISTSRNSTEVDEVGHSSPRTSTVENAMMNPDKSHGDLKIPIREARISSYSAPIFLEKKFDIAEKVKEMQLLSPRKSTTYVLPTPVDAKGILALKQSTSVPGTRPVGQAHNPSRSSFEEKKPERRSVDDNWQGSTAMKGQSVRKESNTHSTSNLLPPPLSEGISSTHCDMLSTSDTRKTKRLAFSGPLLPSKAYSTKPVVSSTGLAAPTELPQLVSRILTRSSISHPSSSPKVSPTASPPLISSPKISELHELPRPPPKPAKSPPLAGHSAPLTFRNQELPMTGKAPYVASSNTASPLPTPPLIVPRSFSIPSSSQRTSVLQVAKHLNSPHVVENAQEVSSPPLTPISLSNIKSASQSGPIKGNTSILLL